MKIPTRYLMHARVYTNRTHHLKSANEYSNHEKDYVGGYNINITFHIHSSLFGPVNIDNVWRIRNNMEIDNLIEGADMVRFIKALRIKWLGHIQRMDQTRPNRKLLDWKPMGTRLAGRPRQRWQKYGMEDLKTES